VTNSFRKNPACLTSRHWKKSPSTTGFFSNFWNITPFHWTPSGNRLFFIYNQRGHQILRLLALQPSTGRVHTVVKERSKTFIDLFPENLGVSLG